jgi:hypothetical protein
MDKKTRTKWTKALRSGKFTQGSGSLRTTAEERSRGKDCFCCLGVLCEVTDTTYRAGFGYPSRSARQKLGLGDAAMDQLVKMNDQEGKSFRQIADWIEKNL